MRVVLVSLEGSWGAWRAVGGPVGIAAGHGRYWAVTVLEGAVGGLASAGAVKSVCVGVLGGGMRSRWGLCVFFRLPEPLQIVAAASWGRAQCGVSTEHGGIRDQGRVARGRAVGWTTGLERTCPCARSGGQCRERAKFGPLGMLGSARA